jgi:hypothetical protein
VHEPFRSALLGTLNNRERTRKLLYSPSLSAVGFNASTSFLAITEGPWLVILDECSEPYVAHATFDDTLLVELTVILLCRQLKLDFAKVGASVAIAMHFAIIEQDQFDILSLEVYARHGGDKLDVIIPRGRPEEVEALIASCLDGKVKAASVAQLATGE